MSTSFQCKTLAMVAGNGYLVTFDPPVGTVALLARAECHVAPIGNTAATPTAPSASPAPAPGAQSAYLHMTAAEVQIVGAEPSKVPLHNIDTPQDLIGWVKVWAIGSGNLVINAH